MWGAINGWSGIATAIFAPILGAIADSGGRRKPWIAFFVCVMAPTSWFLWYALPNQQGLSIGWIAFMLIANSAAFEYSAVFHNAMLPSIAPRAQVGFLSGLGLAAGNASLAARSWCSCSGRSRCRATWTGASVPDHALFGLDTAAHQQDRITGPIAAGVAARVRDPAVRVHPGPRLEPDRRAPVPCARAACSSGTPSKELRRYRNVAAYLVARMIWLTTA